MNFKEKTGRITGGIYKKRLHEKPKTLAKFYYN